jgi:hypothetical protein
VPDVHVIVWDLDLTLGRFDALNNRGGSTEAIRVLLRPHLREALESLTAAGFIHTLLTLGTPLYADLILRGTGLRDYFDLVEGHGQRGKGDAAGVASAIGISDDDRPHRMIFVGDHPINDEPRDPRVLFHLEVFALSRSARDMAALVLALRERGDGSLREGFEKTGQGRSWRRLWLGKGPLPADRPARRMLPGLAPLLLLKRREDSPVIAFAQPPNPAAEPAETAFVPASIASPWRGP